MAEGRWAGCGRDVGGRWLRGGERTVGRGADGDAHWRLCRRMAQTARALLEDKTVNVKIMILYANRTEADILWSVA